MISCTEMLGRRLGDTLGCSASGLLTTANVYHVFSTGGEDFALYSFEAKVNEYTNDATLVLPTASLGTYYTGSTLLETFALTVARTLFASYWCSHCCAAH